MSKLATESTPVTNPTVRRSDLLLAAILLVGAVLRFSGHNWDNQTHMHPDERFLTGVETKLVLPANLREYFDTTNSRFNPHNNGDTFFVYGTLPIFIVRILGEWAGETDYSQIHLVGRAASASFDLISIYLVFLIGSRLYSRRVGLLAAAFSAFSVLLIQHAHFFVVDPFANTFILGGIYFAVRALDEDRWLNYACSGYSWGWPAPPRSAPRRWPESSCCRAWSDSGAPRRASTPAGWSATPGEWLWRRWFHS